LGEDAGEGMGKLMEMGWEGNGKMTAVSVPNVLGRN
jgi:hypothetical protein